MTLRTRVMVFTRSVGRANRFTGLACFTILTLRYWFCLAGVSATWTAPPPINAQPAAQAESFARAIRTDINGALFSLSLQVRCEPVPQSIASS